MLHKRTLNCVLIHACGVQKAWKISIRISHCSVRMTRDCCTGSLVSVEPSCPTAPGSGRSCLDRPSLSIAGPLSRSTALRSCCWTWHFLRSWTTAQKWSRASHSYTTTLGSSFTTLTCGCVPSRLSGCAGEPSSTSKYDPAMPWRTVFAVAVTDEEWWNGNFHGCSC